MTRRYKLLAILVALGSVPVTAQAQMPAGPPPAPHYAPPYATPAVYTPTYDAAAHGGGYQAVGVGDRYAVPADYQIVAPTQSAVVQAAAQSVSVDIGSLAPAYLPVPLASATQPAPIAAQVPVPAAIPIPPPTTYRLDELVGIASTYNPILRREEADIEAAQGERVQAGLYKNPVMFTNNPQIWAGQNSFVNFGFRQLIRVKGKMRIDKAAADQSVRSNTADYRIERSNMLTQVRIHYYQALAAKHRVYLAQHLTMIAQRGVEGARQLEKAGEGTLTDVLLLDTEYQREQIRLQNAETTYRCALQQLAAVVGVSGLVIDDIQGTLFDAPPQFDEQNVQTFLANDSSYAERAKADITQKQAQLRRAEVEPYPDLDVGPHFVTGTFPSSAQFWFTVEFDIPTWNLNQGNIRKTSAEVHKTIEQRDVTFNELHRQTSELFANHRAARDRAERIRVEILPNAQEAQALVQDGFGKGLFNVNRLLQSQRNLAEVSSDYFDAAEKAWTTSAEIGGLLQMEQFP